MLRTADKRLLLGQDKNAKLKDVMGAFSWADMQVSQLPVASPTAWYCADDTSTIILNSDDSDGAYIWKDKSGNNYNLVQGTVSSRPTTGTRTLNGLNVLDFDGGDWMDSNVDASDRTMTSFFVILFDSGLASAPTLRSGGVGSGTGGNHFATNGSLITNKENIAQLAIQGNASASTGTAYCCVQVLDTSSITHYLGATSETDSDSTTFTASRTMRIGARFDGAQALDGYIGEILVYNTALNSTNIGLVREYLKQKWGVS